jgi:hypothetical protein
MLFPRSPLSLLSADPFLCLKRAQPSFSIQSPPQRPDPVVLIRPDKALLCRSQDDCALIEFENFFRPIRGRGKSGKSHFGLLERFVPLDYLVLDLGGMDLEM